MTDHYNEMNYSALREVCEMAQSRNMTSLHSLNHHTNQYQ